MVEQVCLFSINGKSILLSTPAFSYNMEDKVVKPDTTTPSITLAVKPSRFSLISFDVESVIAETFLIFSRIPFKRLESDSKYAPILQYGQRAMHGFKEIISFIQSNSTLNIDANLSPQQIAEVHAYSSLMEDKLKTALIFNWWIKDDSETVISNYSTVKEACFNSFLERHVYGPLYRNRQIDMLERERGDLNEANTLTGARSCLKALQLLLLGDELDDKKLYFFGGKNPTSFDAIVFGYLYCFKFPKNLPDLTLKTLLETEFKPLDAFCLRIKENFLDAVEGGHYNWTESVVLSPSISVIKTVDGKSSSNANETDENLSGKHEGNIEGNKVEADVAGNVNWELIKAAGIAIVSIAAYLFLKASRKHD